MSTPVIRKRTGSWSTFERRFQPRYTEDESVLVEIFALPKDIDPRLVWTVTDDDGRLYLNPGYRFVNRFAYVICEVPWSDIDTMQPPYRFD
ncbi:MAG: hypothetical protein SFW65_04820 [Alphaproteobacteria bacterium]|nr:hypothetical protein [Alphaproteobacteria bacterium]